MSYSELSKNRLRIFLIFIACTFVFVPNFFQALPTDTQPWFMLILLGFLLLNALKGQSNIFQFLLIFGLGLCFVSYRILNGFDDEISKLIPLTFFLIFIFTINKKDIDFLLSNSFFPILVHCLLGFLLLPLMPSIFDLIYGRVPDSSAGFYSRSINFAYPEPSFAAKVLAITGLTMCLAFGRRFINKSRFLFTLSILTLSLTGIILGVLGIFYTLDKKFKFYFIFISFFILLLIYFGYIQLPGRLGTLQNLITNFNFLLIFSDQSFLDRISVLNQMTNQFYDFDLRGTQLTDKSISFFIFLQMGFIGLIFLFLIILVLVGRLFLGDFILPLAFLAIAYSDSFLYPSIIFFIFYLILDTLKKYSVLFRRASSQYATI